MKYWTGSAWVDTALKYWDGTKWVVGNKLQSYDSDAQAFFTASGLSDTTRMAAINTLVTDLKSNSLWTLADAIYPIAGTTATINKYNLKDPRDLDAAFRLSFAGTVTHNSSGITGNGSTGYADTHWVPSTQSGTGKTASGGVYSITDSIGAYVDMGAKDANSYYFQIYSSFGYNFYGQPNENNRTPETISINDTQSSRGWFFISRTDNLNTFIARNTTKAAFSSGLSSDAQAPTISVYLMAQNISGTASLFSQRTLAFGWLGQTLSQSQSDTLYGLIQTYQTSLSRQY